MNLYVYISERVFFFSGLFCSLLQGYLMYSNAEPTSLSFQRQKNIMEVRNYIMKDKWKGYRKPFIVQYENLKMYPVETATKNYWERERMINEVKSTLNLPPSIPIKMPISKTFLDEIKVNTFGNNYNGIVWGNWMTKFGGGRIMQWKVCFFYLFYLHQRNYELCWVFGRTYTTRKVNMNQG